MGLALQVLLPTELSPRLYSQMLKCGHLFVSKACSPGVKLFLESCGGARL